MDKASRDVREGGIKWNYSSSVRHHRPVLDRFVFHQNQDNNESTTHRQIQRF